MAYNYKRFSRENIDDLIKIFNESGKTKVSKEKFLKKYDTDYLKVSFVGYFAYDEQNNPAAFYGVIPFLGKDKNNHNILIAQSADTITHPNHQKKGLFITLANMTYELATSLNIHFLYGIPNYLSFPGFIKKLDWQQDGFLKIYKTKVLTLPLAPLVKKYAFLKTIYENYCHLIFNLLAKKSNFEAFKTNDVHYLIDYSADYVFYKNYTKKYFLSVQGVNIWTAVDGYLKIGDINGLTHENMQSFLKKLKLISFLIGSHKIIFQCNDHFKGIDILNKFIEPQEGLPIIYKNLSQKYSTENYVIKYADVDTF